MADNCGYAITWIFGLIPSLQLVLVVTLWVYQLQEKSENIPYNYVHSKDSICKKLASEHKISAQESRFLIWSPKISYLEPWFWGIACVSAQEIFSNLSRRKSNISHSMSPPYIYWNIYSKGLQVTFSSFPFLTSFSFFSTRDTQCIGR